MSKLGTKQNPIHLNKLLNKDLNLEYEEDVNSHPDNRTSEDKYGGSYSSSSRTIGYLMMEARERDILDSCL